MGRPVYGVENFFSARQYPSHTVASDPAATAGQEAFRVGAGRRRPALNSWACGTENVAANLEVACGQARGANFAAIDGHNLIGETVRLQVSSDDFTTTTEVWAATIPANPATSTKLSEGGLTEDGTYIRSFDLHVGQDWRFVVDAMGAGLKPEVAGGYIGKYFSPAHQVIKPFSYGESELLASADPSPVIERRRGQVHLKLAGDLEFEQARYHFDGLFFRERPMWLVHDDEEAEKALLVKRVPGSTGLIQVEGDWSEFQVQFDWVELEPEART